MSVPFLVYDTETTGLPDWSKPSNDPCQPYITQLACQLCEEDGAVISSMNFLIQPAGWTIPDDVSAMTGLTTERCSKFGVPIELAIEFFLMLWRSSAIRVGHNESFDARLIRIALLRHPDLTQFADEWKDGNSFCTKNKSISIINLPPSDKMMAAGKRGPKPPNLAEAYRHFTGKDLDGAHNAAVDVMACKTVFLSLQSMGV